MWRFIFIVAIFISAFSIGDAQKFEFGYKCMNGYMQFNRHCRKVVLPYFDCPIVQQGSGCVEQTKYCSSNELTDQDQVPSGSIVATRGCREGFTLDSNKDICIGNVEVESSSPSVVCAAGCGEKNGRCFESEPTRTVCDKGCTYEKSFTKYGDYSCPSNFDRHRAWVFDWFVYTTTCTWVESKYNKVCRWNNTRPSGNICYNVDYPCSISYYCPAGELKYGKCMETIQRQREFVCPSADSQDTLRFRCSQPDPLAAGRCGYADPVPICPDNYEILPGGQKCLSISTIPAEKQE